MMEDEDENENKTVPADETRGMKKHKRFLGGIPHVYRSSERYVNDYDRRRKQESIGQRRIGSS